MSNLKGHRKTLLKSFCCLVLAFFFGFIAPVEALALSHRDHIVFKENNILFYNPDEGCIGNEPSLTIIGDSLSVQMRDANKFSEAFENATVDAIWGRPWVSNTANFPDLPEGLASVRGGVSSDALIWLLGNNNRDHISSNWFSNLEEKDITALHDAVGDSTPVFLMTNFDDANHSVFDSNNALIRAAAEKYDNWHLLDWASLGASNPDYTVTLDTDYNDATYGTFKMHLTEAGMDAFIQMIKDALAEYSSEICAYRNSAPDPCGEFNGNSGGGSWNGSCSGVGPYEQWINTHQNTIKTIAARNQLPWEAIMAQTILESSGGTKTVCPYNPLGLKARANWPSCDGQHAIFSSFDEAFDYYVNSIIPVREAKGKFVNDPYGYIDFIQNKASAKYATDEGYVQKASALVCGIQKRAGSYSNPDTSSYSGGSTSRSSANCVIDAGGLTEEEAKKFVINYGANKGGLPERSMNSSLWNACGGPFGSNCVSFAAFFLNAFTSTKYARGNGYQVAGNLSTAKGNTPSVFSVFSSEKYGDFGHVAVVLGIQDGKYIIGHASCSRGNSGKRGPGDGTQGGSGSAFVKIETSSDPSSWWGMNGTTPTFAYPQGVNQSAIKEFAK